MRIAYEQRRFSKDSLQVIEQANSIIESYQNQGFTLTLRQLYYQFVSRDLVSNTVKSYKRLGSIINDARLSGLVSWDAIEDRTRNLRSLATWDEPADIMDAVVKQYKIDMWDNQVYRPEVWIEKDALVGVIERVCNRYRVPFFACRGYNSQSEQWAAGRRMLTHIENGQTPVVLHLGDHDPSGIDMTRDNMDRLSVFAEASVVVERLALNMDQVRQYKPPPNPAKSTDSRYEDYLENFGEESWELDALEPSIIEDLIESAITGFLDEDLWREAGVKEESDRGKLKEAQQQLRS